jgi:hypothetical protein
MNYSALLQLRKPLQNAPHYAGDFCGGELHSPPHEVLEEVAAQQSLHYHKEARLRLEDALHLQKGLVLDVPQNLQLIEEALHPRLVLLQILLQKYLRSEPLSIVQSHYFVDSRKTSLAKRPDRFINIMKPSFI